MDTRIGSTVFVSGYPIDRTYANGNYADYGRIHHEELGWYYARTDTWGEDLLLQQAIPVRRGRPGHHFS